jgi:hypothetical protein
LWIGALSLLMYALFVDAHADALIRNYIQRQYDSQGAAVRVAMNAVPAAIFLAFRRRLAADDQARRLWAWMSSLALLGIPLLLVSPSSTAVDRMALYLIPVQIFVFSRLPDLAGRNRHLGNALTVAVVGFCAAVQAVWLNFASHSYAWLPYRFYPLELL